METGSEDELGILRIEFAEDRNRVSGLRNEAEKVEPLITVMPRYLYSLA